jgi:HSP20 family protein
VSTGRQRAWKGGPASKSQGEKNMTDAPKLPEKTEKTSQASEGWNPFDSLRREIDRLFEDFHPFGGRLPTPRLMSELDRPLLTAGWEISPAFDLIEREKEYEITAELPGIDEKDVDIKLSNRTMTIRGEKKVEKKEKEKDYYLSERRYGSFRRSFQIPPDVDPDKIEASFLKGVLTLTLPKTAEAQSSERKISVKAA